MTLEITVAPAFDWGTASEILIEVVKGLNQRGKPLWTEEQVSVEGLKSSYRIEESFIAHQKNKPIGCMFLLESDPEFWPEIDDHSSLFLHKLAVLQEFHGKGVGNKMLEWASEYAKRQGKLWLRLECDGSRPKLKEIYETFGFRLVDRKPLGEFDSARYEIRV
jgi:GNAT superfamily N-acetyltransferase